MFSEEQAASGCAIAPVWVNCALFPVWLGEGCCTSMMQDLVGGSYINWVCPWKGLGHLSLSLWFPILRCDFFLLCVLLLLPATIK
jgi:hypothetical protein